MCERLLTTEAELAVLAELLPAAGDGYSQAALYGLRKRPNRIELFHDHSSRPTVYVRRQGRYELRDHEHELFDLLQEAL